MIFPRRVRVDQMRFVPIAWKTIPFYETKNFPPLDIWSFFEQISNNSTRFSFRDKIDFFLLPISLFFNWALQWLRDRNKVERERRRQPCGKFACKCELTFFLKYSIRWNRLCICNYVPFAFIIIIRCHPKTRSPFCQKSACSASIFFFKCQLHTFSLSRVSSFAFPWNVEINLLYNKKPSRLAFEFLPKIILFERNRWS